MSYSELLQGIVVPAEYYSDVHGALLAQQDQLINPAVQAIAPGSLSAETKQTLQRQILLQKHAALIALYSSDRADITPDPCIAVDGVNSHHIAEGLRVQIISLEKSAEENEGTVAALFAKRQASQKRHLYDLITVSCYDSEREAVMLPVEKAALPSRYRQTIKA